MNAVPRVTLRIQRVDETTVGQGLRQFSVLGREEHPNGVSELWHFETLSQWKALACKRARETRTRARIDWREGKPKRWGGTYPKEIVNVELLHD